METTMVLPQRRIAGATGYEFEGDWDPPDRIAIEAVMRQCLPAEIPPIFDTWKLLCFRGRFIARRLTWEIGGQSSIYARDVSELASYLLANHGMVAEVEECPYCQRPLLINGDGRCACCGRIIVKKAA